MPPREREKEPEVFPGPALEGELEQFGISISPFVSWQRPPLDISKEALLLREIKQCISGSTLAVLEAMGEYHREDMESAKAQTERLLAKLEEDNKVLIAQLEEIKEQNKRLRNGLLLMRPDVQLLGAFVIAGAGFVVSLLVWFLTGIVIINPTVSLIGGILSIGSVIMALLFRRDWHAIRRE